MEQSNSTEYIRQHVIDSGLCTNCGACVNLCPYYVSCNDRTVILDECTITDGSCMDICPRTPTDIPVLTSLLFEEKNITPEAGAIKGFYITRAADEKIRKNAQHGGTVTALINLALKEGLIDAAVLSNGENLMLPVGAAITEDSEVAGLSKSRFVVTPVVATFNELVKKEAKSIGIVATPCQTLALAKMKNSKHPRIKENAQKLRLIIGLFCGWALSSSALQDLLSKNADLDSITGMDIPPSKYHTLEVYTKKRTVSISLDEVEKCVRPNCRSCTDMTAEFSDISVGSARLQEGWDEARSWNQVIVRTETGQKLIDLARQKGVLEFREVPEGNLERLKQASMSKRKTGQENLETMLGGKR
jgi:coenzyme F420 hydrogenase subunit beta